MAAPGHVAEDSTADLSTQHSRPLFGDMPYLIWYCMSLMTAQAVLR